MAISAFHPLLRGHRPLQLAHRGSDAGRAHLRGGLRRRGPARAGRRVRAELFGSLGDPATGTARSRRSCSASRARHPRAPTSVRPTRLAEVVPPAGCGWAAPTRSRATSTPSLLHRRKNASFHANGMRFTAWASADRGGRGTAARARVLLGRRRVRARPGRGRRERIVPTTRRDLPLHHRRPAARALRGDRPADQRRHDGQRAAWRTEAEVREGLLHSGRPCRSASTTAAAPRACCRAASRCRGAHPACPRSCAARPRRPARRHGLGDPLRARRQRGERLGRADRHAPDQRRGRHHPRGAALLHRASYPARTTKAWCASCSPPRPSAASTRRTPRSRAPRSGARARSGRRPRPGTRPRRRRSRRSPCTGCRSRPR